MKALQIIKSNEVAIREVPQPDPGKGEALVQISAAALNRRDQWIREGKYPNIIYNTTLGSDGCGKVVKLGPGAAAHWKNKTVVINPNINWGNDPTVQSSTYQVLGMPTPGTLGEFIVVPDHRLAEKPGHLTDEEGAALPLAGLTAYRAVFHHGLLKKAENVLITGIGGGVSQMAFQWAVAKGATVSVTSGSGDKLQRMKESGAAMVYNYHEEWAREASSRGVQFDLIIDSAGGPQFNALIKLLKPGGRLVFYGATTGLPTKMDLYRMFWNQVTLQGSTMGNDQEFMEMISFVKDHKLRPMIDSVRPFDEIVEAMDKMRQSRQFGKLVVSLT